nr:unnamed protein product [Timema shepardi]
MTGNSNYIENDTLRHVANKVGLEVSYIDLRIKPDTSVPGPRIEPRPPAQKSDTLPLDQQVTNFQGEDKRQKEKLICDRSKPLHHAGQVIRQVLRCARVLPSNGDTPHIIALTTPSPSTQHIAILVPKTVVLWVRATTTNPHKPSISPHGCAFRSEIQPPASAGDRNKLRCGASFTSGIYQSGCWVTGIPHGEAPTPAREPRASHAHSDVRDLYELLLQKEALENRLGQHEVVRKSNRSPSLRLRFGRRADPSIAVRIPLRLIKLAVFLSDALDHVATEAGWGKVSNDYNNNVIIREVFSPVFSRSSVVERLGFYSQLSLQKCPTLSPRLIGGTLHLDYALFKPTCEYENIPNS